MRGIGIFCFLNEFRTRFANLYHKLWCTQWFPVNLAFVHFLGQSLSFLHQFIQSILQRKSWTEVGQKALTRIFFWLAIECKSLIIREWGRPDSNWRRPKSRDLQSLAIATMRHPRRRLLAIGLEPTTIRLQVGRSTIELCQQEQ